MTQPPSDVVLAAAAVAHVIAKLLLATGLCSMGLVISVAFWKGRGMESDWPDDEWAPESQARTSRDPR